MKKSNFIVLGAAFAISLFLLWLWWYLGFAKVDGPADVLISLAWWAVIGLAGFGIYRYEQRRRQQMRTVYVAPSALFNCESGLVECAANPGARAALVEQIIQNLDYGFDFKDMPERNEFDCSYIVRTEEYQDAENWRGTVVKVDRSGKSKEKPFTSAAALANMLR